jgi:hypothetical protein
LAERLQAFEDFDRTLRFLAAPAFEAFLGVGLSLFRKAAVEQLLGRVVAFREITTNSSMRVKALRMMYPY